MQKFTSASVILLATNETKSLEAVVEALLECCSHEDLAEFIILLGRASTDECLACAQRLRDESTRVPVILFRQSIPGMGAEVDKVFALASGSHIVTMSSDLENDPGTVAVFIDTAKENPDAIVTASRRIEGGSFSGYPPFRRLANRLAQIFLGLLYTSRLTDITNSFQLTPTQIMRSIEWYKPGRAITLEITLKPMRLGVRFIEVPSKWVVRDGGATKHPLSFYGEYLKTALKIRFCKKSELLRK